MVFEGLGKSWVIECVLVLVFPKRFLFFCGCGVTHSRVGWRHIVAEWRLRYFVDVDYEARGVVESIGIENW